jgi:hypothetical protein
MKAGGKRPLWRVEIQHTRQQDSFRWFLHKRTVSQESAEELGKSIMGQKVRLGVFDVMVEKARLNGPEGQVINL